MSFKVPDASSTRLLQQIGEVDSTDRGAATQIVKLATQAASDLGNPDGIGSSVVRAQLLDAALMKLDAGAGHLKVAQTAVKDAADLGQIEQQRFDEVFGTTDLSAHEINAQNVLDGLSGLQSSAKTLGAQDSHDGWYRSGIDWIVRTSSGEGKMSNAQLKAAGVTQFEGVAGRNTGARFSVLQHEARASETGDGKVDYREALENARNGIDSALQAAVYTLHSGTVQFKDLEGAASEGLPSPLQSASGQMLLGSAARTDLQALGQKLTTVVNAYDADPSSFNWEQHGNAVDFAKNGQFFFVNRDLARDSSKSKLQDGVAAFDDMSADLQVQNLRSMIAGLAGALRADTLNRQVLETGSSVDTDAGQGLQLLLDYGSQAALAERQVKDGRKQHGQAVADQITPQLGHLMQLKASDGDTNATLVRMHGAIDQAVQQAGQQLSFSGAGAASVVAVEMAGKFLDVAFPGRFESEAAAGAYAKQIFTSAGYGACRKFAEQLGHDTSSLGATSEIKANILEAKKDDWGIDGLTAIAEDDTAFTDQEQADFGLLMTLFNATWITTQEGRARLDERGDGSDSRVQSGERDVYQPYLSLLRGTDGQDAIFRIAQDLMEAQKKSAD